VIYMFAFIFWEENCLFLLVYLFSVYGEPIPVKELADRVASYVHLCTLYWWLRYNDTSSLVVNSDLYFVVFHINKRYIMVLQTFWMWCHTRRLWQGWATVVHGWTFRCFLCKLLLFALGCSIFPFCINLYFWYLF